MAEYISVWYLLYSAVTIIKEPLGVLDVCQNSNTIIYIYFVTLVTANQLKTFSWIVLTLRNIVITP